ncbi:MAG: CBS domain-containing protein [Chlamydiae bacterium]|nr:CBS domain-containing protein [Chlamydiota bacterium]
MSFDELEHIIRTSKKKGILNIEEANLIEGCLKLQSSSSKEHMKTKEEIHFFNINDDINNLIKIFSKEGFSRIPVCDNDIDHLLGIISLKRFFFYQEHIKSIEDLKKYLKKPFFVPENISSWSLLSELRAKNEDMALVVDEYGSILGIITQEDLVEGVIGEISDKKELKPKYSLTDDVLIASGQMPIDDLEEIFDLSLPRLGRSVTIGGWLTDQMGDIPQPGTKFSTKELFFYVIEADVKKVKKVYVRLLKPLKKKKHG